MVFHDSLKIRLDSLSHSIKKLIFPLNSETGMPELFGLSRGVARKVAHYAYCLNVLLDSYV